MEQFWKMIFWDGKQYVGQPEGSMHGRIWACCVSRPRGIVVGNDQWVKRHEKSNGKEVMTVDGRPMKRPEPADRWACRFVGTVFGQCETNEVNVGKAKR